MNFHEDRGDADGALLVFALVGIVAVLIAARWGWQALIWTAAGTGLALMGVAITSTVWRHTRDDKETTR